MLLLRILVIVSLYLQTLLILLGSRRKYIVNAKLHMFLWFIYISADWIATIALTILSTDTQLSTIKAIWAPFLLLHLGGPDTITAYSLEDNELWLRHILGLVYHLAVAVYVVYRSWNGNSLNYVTILIFLVGIIKYAEKTWSLWSGSTKGFRAPIFPSPNPGPNYVIFMDRYTEKLGQGYRVTLENLNETTSQGGEVAEADLENLNSEGGAVAEADHKNPNISPILDGFRFYNIPRCLFADLILSFQDHNNSQKIFNKATWEHAFEVVAVELGLIYDMLYTKAVLTYTRRGIFLKLLSFFSTLIAFIVFSFLHIKGPTSKHMSYDLIITFVLFIGAILLEIYALIVLLSSSWTMHWISGFPKNWKIDLFNKSISLFQKFFKLSNTVTWSNRMSEFNLTRLCMKDEPVRCIKIQKLFQIYGFFENAYYQKVKDVSPKLKELIFEELKEKSEEAKDIKACKKLFVHKGDRVLDKWSCSAHDDINQSIKEVDFDQSILLWHIATDLCYYSDESHPDMNPIARQSRETSQLLSDYMLYLLVMRPFMLPNGIGQIRFVDTCAEVDELLKDRKYKYITERNQLCEMILRVNTNVPPSEVKGDRSKSVLFDACRLAKSLQSLEKEENGSWSKEKKWGMISRVWVEMLCHAASQCRGLHHAKQLSQGGELLTHVWLLMAHLGISEKFQILEGHARAKLKFG